MLTSALASIPPVLLLPVDRGLHDAFAWEQNSPNPFNPTTFIGFELAGESNARLDVYDPSGKRVTSVMLGMLRAGRNEVAFDGAGLPSGVYAYRLEAGGRSAARRMVLLK